MKICMIIEGFDIYRNYGSLVFATNLFNLPIDFTHTLQTYFIILIRYNSFLVNTSQYTYRIFMAKILSNTNNKGIIVLNSKTCM